MYYYKYHNTDICSYFFLILTKHNVLLTMSAGFYQTFAIIKLCLRKRNKWTMISRYRSNSTQSEALKSDKCISCCNPIYLLLK